MLCQRGYSHCTATKAEHARIARLEMLAYLISVTVGCVKYRLWERFRLDHLVVLAGRSKADGNFTKVTAFRPCPADQVGEKTRSATHVRGQATRLQNRIAQESVRQTRGDSRAATNNSCPELGATGSRLAARRWVFGLMRPLTAP